MLTSMPPPLFPLYLVHSKLATTKRLIKRILRFTGPGCSSFGYGAMEELGPFRVNSDGKTLYRNVYAWNTGKQILISLSNDRVKL